MFLYPTLVQNTVYLCFTHFCFNALLLETKSFSNAEKSRLLTFSLLLESICNLKVNAHQLFKRINSKKVIHQTNLALVQSLYNASKSFLEMSLQRFTPGWMAPSPRNTRTCSTVHTTGFISKRLSFVYTVCSPPTRCFKNRSKTCGRQMSSCPSTLKEATFTPCTSTILHSFVATPLGSVEFSELISRGESAGLEKNGSVLKSLPDTTELPEWTGRVAGTAIVVITIKFLNVPFYVVYFLITPSYMLSSLLHCVQRADWQKRATHPSLPVWKFRWTERFSARLTPPLIGRMMLHFANHMCSNLCVKTSLEGEKLQPSSFIERASSSMLSSCHDESDEISHIWAYPSVSIILKKIPHIYFFLLSINRQCLFVTTNRQLYW